MNGELRRFLTILFGSTFLACLLGICLDLVTANVAVEYFSVHHPRILPTENPWALALLWGIIASWWFGAVAGAIVALINYRRQQPLEAIRILKWTAVACVALWMIMISILVTIMAISSTIPVEQRRASFETDRRLVAVAMAHQYEYVLGTIAMLVIAVMTWRSKPLISCMEKIDQSSDEP
jgi:hypothetical protein